MAIDTSALSDKEYNALIDDERRDRSIPCVDKNGQPLKRGDRVRIFKGTALHSMKSGDIVCGKTYVVSLHSVCKGYEGHSQLSGEPGKYVTPPTVTWPGSGGYWTRCDSRLVELVSAQEK